MSADYLRVEKALRYLEGRLRHQPSLKEVAEHVGLSPYHFHRLFKRWAGVSPKRFLQFLTVEHAKKLLEENNNILEATYDAGLSSPGRLHDLFVAVEAVTPGQFKTRGRGVEIVYGVHPSPFGRCLLATTERGISALSFIPASGLQKAVADLQAEWEKARLRESPQTTRPLMDKIFSPGPDASKGPLNLFLKGTNFQIKVWKALLKIPPGFVCSYETVAGYLGEQGAARAVGNAVALNPVAYIIPCHRVIRKIGAFGGYRYGPSRKKAMVGWEAARSHRSWERG